MSEEGRRVMPAADLQDILAANDRLYVALKDARKERDDARAENTKLLAVVEAAEALYTPYPAETPIAARPTTLLRAALDALATGKESE